MSKSANQKLKIYYLAKIMLEKTDENHGLTLPEICAELDKYGITAERKSIYDDMRALESIGIEIQGVRYGRNYVYNVVGRPFELAELKLLVDSIQSSKFITQKKSGELIKKLENFVSEYEAKQLNRQVFVQNRTKTVNENIYYNVDGIHTAIAENRKIKFRYFNWNTKKEREFRKDGGYYIVSPWALSWDDENYYMIGYDRAADMVKHYRVDKMLEIETIDEKREGREYFERFDLASYARKNFSMYGGAEETVKLEIRNEYAGILIDRFGRDISFRPVDSEHSAVNVDVFVSNQFFAWLFPLKDGIKITGPEKVLNQARQFLKELQEVYDPADSQTDRR